MNDDRVWQAIDEQRLRLVALLDSLTDDEWERPSLCAGWTVRHVAAHLTYAQSTWPEILGEFVRHPAGMKRGIREGAIRRSDSSTTGDLTQRIGAMVGSRRHIAAVTEKETLIDILVHSQDIAIPLGRPFDLDPEAEAFAAARVWAMGYPFWARRRFPQGGTLLRLTGRDIPTR